MSNDHFVPVGYLKNFTDADGKFWQVTKKYWHPKYIYPEQTCYTPGGNQIPQDLLDRFDLDDPFILEKQGFKDYEDNVRLMSDMFLSRAPILPFKLFIFLCHGYILHKQRTPYYQKGIDEVNSKHGETFINDTIAQQRKEAIEEYNKMPKEFREHPDIKPWMSDEYWDELKRKLTEQPRDSHDTQLFGLIRTAMGRNLESVKMLGKLTSMELVIMNAYDGHNFFTSDNPGYATGLDETMPQGVGTSNTNFGGCFAVTLPINSKQAVYITYGERLYTETEDRVIKYVDLSIKDTIAVNHGTIYWADDKIMCADKQDLMRYKPVN